MAMKPVLWSAVIVCAVCFPGIAAGQATNINQVPNAGFGGDLGYRFGDAQGAVVPDYWRAFAVGGGGANVEIVPLAANALFPGSPATNAVRVSITFGGGDQGFDHDLTPFSFQPGVSYTASVYIRSANGDGSSQGVDIAVPVFDVNGFTGRQPGSFSATATQAWQQFSGPAFTEAEDTSGILAFRLQDDGGDNAILIAMPEVEGPAYVPPAVSYPPIYTMGRQFTASDRWVGTHVFHWFMNYGGQIQGPWRPVEGRGKWTGEVPFWRDQIKDMMDSNIEVLYVHLWNGFHLQREQFFEALNQLRREGYDTPLVMPFLDPLIIWGENGETIEVASTAGKDEYVRWYNIWLDQYFRYNTDDTAHSRLVTLDGKFVLNTWHGNPDAIVNLSALSRQDVESRLIAYNADRFPAVNNGIYQIGTTNGVAPSFSDELASQFSILAYEAYITHNGRRTVMLSPGNWDQNVRDPGLFLARDGGVHYEDVWDDLLAEVAGGGGPPIRHLFLKSWNEYDEGTGLFASDPGPPHIAPSNTGGNNDVFSTTDNPREYIDTTYTKASQFNNHAARDSRFLWSDFPTSLSAGEAASVNLLVRNEGNQKWSGASGIRLSETVNGHAWGPATTPIDAVANEVSRYGGVFRGRPVLFEVDVTAPQAPGVHAAEYAMTGGNGAAFGETFTFQAAVGEDDVQAGHSGAFFNPARNGEGNYVEILDGDRAVVYTFTYRPDGSGPAWFLGTGAIEGGSIVIDELFRPTGTPFGPGFDKDEIEFSPAGSMSLGFVDCQSGGSGGVANYSGSEALGFERLLSRAGRISQITGCGRTPHANAGLSGSYYDPARNGEGIVVQWLTNGDVLVIMFTYDLNGEQFWVFGLGTPDGDTVTMDALYPAVPTSWGSGFDPDEISLESWGSFTLTWANGCNAVTFEYDATLAGYGSATRNYSRLTRLAETSCPVTN